MGEQEKEKAKEESNIAKVVITHDYKTGKLAVSGPGLGEIFDEPMCFWLLDAAKDFIKSVNRQKMKPRIIPVTGMPGRPA